MCSSKRRSAERFRCPSSSPALAALRCSTVSSARLRASLQRSLDPRPLISCALVTDCVVAAACTALAACSGLKEALTAHVDVVAKAALAGAVRQPPRRPARQRQDPGAGDQGQRRRSSPTSGPGTSSSRTPRRTAIRSNDKKAIDAAFAPLVNQQKLNRVHGLVSKTLQGRLGQRGHVQPGRRRTARRAPHSHRLQESGRARARRREGFAPQEGRADSRAGDPSELHRHGRRSTAPTPRARRTTATSACSRPA